MPYISIAGFQAALRERSAPPSRAEPHECRLDVKRFLALLPVAGAQLVGLQRVEHAQNFLRVAAHGKIGHVHEANDVLRIDDEGGALGDAGLLIQDAERRATDRA